MSFAIHRRPRRNQWQLHILYSSGSDESSNLSEDDDNQDYNTDQSTSNRLTSMPKIILTDTELEHRKAEMLLIASLTHGDQPAIANFKRHWFGERGTNLSGQMMEADFVIGKGPEHWEHAEELLLCLIQEDATFLEPRARLSKLYCLQGKFDLAKTLSLQVLESKPWHFVAVETMVAIATAQQQEVQMQLWKSRLLPVPSQVQKRNQWVDRALEDAEAVLSRMMKT